ncbi:MAG: patatin-like phospholipase family protein, partial [Alistipes sp.]|nr:patatin-like phospholipase family protein [Alistipes sp.]
MRIFLSIIITILLLLPSVAEAQSVGVVMSGGGAKGLYHIGVLRALEENGIPIDYISGTSMGSIIGGLYAAGYSIEEMEQV